jgi:hypothetical protein
VKIYEVHGENGYGASFCPKKISKSDIHCPMEAEKLWKIHTFHRKSNPRLQPRPSEERKLPLARMLRRETNKKKTQRTLRNGLQASPTVGCGHCSCAACCAARCCTRVWVERCAQSSGGNGKQKKKGGSTRRCDSVGLCAATKPRKATALNRPEKSKP